ncbi:hypothetical protein NHX12_019203 [Muraenolepis orangiensis]|uniref:AP-5 complex subunit sigma-1 n=1 Tax=Muraenolepis orangiensis TaxID=630683 RepID=A0A9Q0EWC0_9TELE|nr:hypothetical protein NHX12_019203 [Muraenolepis orangiensis]
MVHCFLIHTAGPVSGPGPGDSRVLFSRVFGPHLQGRSLQRDQLMVVLSSVSLSREASGRGSGAGEGGGVPATDEGTALQEADGGVLRLRAGDPFPGAERSVLWLAVRSLAFTLVCLPHDNLLLAEATLRSLARHCLEHLRLLGNGSEVLLKVDRIDFLLGKLLPHGQLLFLNHRFTQSLEKDITAYMAK